MVIQTFDRNTHRHRQPTLGSHLVWWRGPTVDGPPSRTTLRMALGCQRSVRFRHTTAGACQAGTARSFSGRARSWHGRTLPCLLRWGGGGHPFFENLTWSLQAQTTWEIVVFEWMPQRGQVSMGPKHPIERGSRYSPDADLDERWPRWPCFPSKQRLAQQVFLGI